MFNCNFRELTSVFSFVQIKQASMMLAKIYMKRVAVELESSQYSERESTHGVLLLQGVNFAYRAHQV